MLLEFLKKCNAYCFLSATNLNEALLRAVSMLVKERADGNLPQRSADMIILLTDGMPNHGELSLFGRLEYFILEDHVLPEAYDL